jgi:F-type H+-transporting ATPase subunit epsilon
MATFHLDLVAPDKLTFAGDVDQVDIPGIEGDFGVLPGHAPMMALLRPGILTVYVDGMQTKMVVLGGFAEVSPESVTILAEVASEANVFDITVLAARIAQTEESIKGMEPGSLLDREIQRLDHFRQVDQHLQGTALH